MPEKITGKIIGMVIYANPDYYPPVINAVNLLSKEFDILIICRNQDPPNVGYPNNVRVLRLGQLRSSREKEEQGAVKKILEYFIFLFSVFFQFKFSNCSLVYACDMHGLIAGFFPSRIGKNIPLVYHNLELLSLKEARGFARVVKLLELYLIRYTCKIIFPDFYRASYFQKEANLTNFPCVVKNVPLRLDKLPKNNLGEFLGEKGFNDSARIVMYQGAINDGHSLLEIVKSMVFWPSDTLLVIAGYRYNSFVKLLSIKAKELNLEGRIIMLPFLPYLQLSSYTVGAYIGLALYSSVSVSQRFTAGASNKIYEYLACGTPVITNDSSYFREVVNASFAYFADPYSVNDIARVINLVFSDKEGYHNKSKFAREAHLDILNYEEQFNPVIEYVKGALRG